MSLLHALLAVVAGLPAAPQDTELLSLYVADAATFFPDPKDAPLMEALRLVDDRVSELPGEIPGFPMLPPPVVSLVAHLLTGEKSLHILSSNDPNLMVPVYGQLELKEGSPEKARQIAELLAEMARGSGVPLGEPRQGDGLLPLEAGVPIEVLFGARGADVILSAGKVVEEPIDLSNTGLPAGVEPCLAVHFDLGAMMQLGMGVAAMEDPEEAAEMREFMDTFGMTDMVINLAYGTDEARSYTVVTIPGYADSMRETGILPVRTLTKRDLSLVPVDASWATVGVMNVKGSLELVLSMVEDQLAEVGMGDPIEMIAAMTGFHLETDLVDNLGSAYGMYTSDTTGGGGLLSGVLFFELSNAEKLRDTQARVADILNGLAAEKAEGYVQIRDWSHAGTHYSSVTFPGLPVPFEPTVAFTAHHLFLTLTPQAALAAVDQATSGGPGLATNPRFQENLPGPVEGALTVEFFDTPRLLRSGYGVTSLLCSAVANGTRSRTDLGRDAGVILPPFHQLAAGAKASVGVTRMVGGDLVTRYHGDRSLLVNLTSTVGFVASTPLILALPAMFAGLAGTRLSAAEVHAEYAEEDEDR